MTALYCWRQIIQNPGGLRGWQSAETRERYQAEERKFLIRHRFGGVGNWNYGHAFSRYWQRFGKTHPEFFSLLPDGRRAPLDGDKDGQYITMCVSNPDLWKQIIRDWKNDPLTRPGHRAYRPHVVACENDTPGMCTCPNCRAWDAPDSRFAASDYWSGRPYPLQRRGRFRLARADWGEDGGTAVGYPPSLSDRYAKFYNAVLQEARKSNPKARVVGYAYANYVEGPTATKVDPGVVISFVPLAFFPVHGGIESDIPDSVETLARRGGAGSDPASQLHAGGE